MILTGAGVILFEIDKSDTKRLNVNMILVREISTQKYTEPGGRKEKGNSIVKTARDELYEETSGYIWFSDEKQINQGDNWIDIAKNNAKNYRGYVIFIDDIDINGYYENLDVIDSENKWPKAFFETDEMTKVSVKELKENRKYVEDVFGNTIRLKGRTRKLLKALFSSSLYQNLLTYSPILPYKEIFDGITTLDFSL